MACNVPGCLVVHDVNVLKTEHDYINRLKDCKDKKAKIQHWINMWKEVLSENPTEIQKKIGPRWIKFFEKLDL